MMQPEQQPEHLWLNQFLGQWVSETECKMGPDQQITKNTGTEVVRSIGELWIVAEGESEMPDGSTAKTIMTLGYDPQKHSYVGTFIASMMTHLWIYNGSLDAEGQVLTLQTEGPNFSDDGMAQYQDIIEFVSADHRVMTSQILGEDGKWLRFMTSHYHRQK